MFYKRKVDYTLYLVANDKWFPSVLDVYHQVEQALLNGTTVVQLRKKPFDTGASVERAKRIHEPIQNYSVPLIINDGADVKLAYYVEVMHIGKEDMDSLARKNDWKQ